MSSVIFGLTGTPRFKSTTDNGKVITMSETDKLPIPGYVVYDISDDYADVGEGQHITKLFLNVNVTYEGVIMDVVADGEVVATVGMMADEWADVISNGVI